MKFYLLLYSGDILSLKKTNLVYSSWNIVKIIFIINFIEDLSISDLVGPKNM